MTHFHLAPHTRVSGSVVEIWQGEEMIGTIYSTDDGVRIMSKYFAGGGSIIAQHVRTSAMFPPVIEIHIREAE